MSTQKRSLIYLGLPVGVAVALLLAFLLALPSGAVAAPEEQSPQAPNDITYDYGWENGGTLLSSFGNLSAAANVASGTDPSGGFTTTVTPHGGSAMLQMTESPHSGTPQGYIAYIENLTDTDVITATFWGWDQTSSGSPSLRIWAHYAQSGDVDSYAGSAGGNDAYTDGTGWSQLEWTWTFDSAGGTRDALVIEARLYSTPSSGDYSTDYWIDDLQVVAPDSATVSFPAEPSVQDLTIAKTGPASAQAGEDLVYEITVSNQNIDPATDVVVTDTLPVSTTLVAASGGFTQTNPATGVYVWELGDVLSGTQVTFNVTATVDTNVAIGTVLTNTAAVSIDPAEDDTANNEVEHYATIHTLIPIYDVQFVPDPASDDASPYAGQTVLVEGVVTAKPGEIDTPYRAMVIAEPAGGPWSGLLVYQYSGLPTTINEGDYVRVLGEVQEYYNLTELDPTAGFVEVITPTYGSVPPAALTTGQLPDADPALSEQWEGVLVEFSMATVTDDNLGYGEWAFDDGSGATRANDLGEIDGNLTYVPTNGDVFNFLRGIVWYSFSNYKLEPRRDADIGLHYDTPFISKDAPVTVLPNGLMTYTITVENMIGVELTDVAIYDVVPMTSTFVQALDGGVYDGISVTWDIPSVPDQAAVEVRFVVQADDEPGDNVINDTYYFEAANWVTPTYGTPVWTYIGEYIPISTIQGSDFRSPYEGQPVTTQGEVIGFFEGNSSAYGDYDGFFIQDPIGDGDPATSDAIFINHKTLNVVVNIGDLVEVNGTVDEFSEYDGATCLGIECLTQISVADVGDVIILTAAAAPHAVPATELNPPGDPTASDIYFEALEGMLVTLPNTSTVVGPTSYGAVHAVRGDLGIDRVMRSGPYEGMPVAVRNWELYGEIDGVDPPNLITGSVITNTTGPLNFSYGDYMLITQAGDEWAAEISVAPPSTVPSWPTPNVDEFSVATFNTYNFDSGEPTVKQTKVVSTILQTNGAAFIALEEIEGDDTTFMAGVLADLDAAGYNYDYAYSHSDVGGHGVSLLWNTDIVTDVVASTEYQGCSEYGSSSSSYDPLWETCRAMGEYPLFSRRPVVVTGTVQLDSGDVQVVAIANHFKSKAGNDPTADPRRLEQGMFVNALVADLIANGSPNVIVMGDLNDFEDSPALEALYANGTLTNTWMSFTGDEPYSYIYEGVSQILDHILASPAMNEWLADMGPLHLNADFPYAPYTNDGNVVWRTSDHDPVAATFLLPNLEVDFTSNSPVILGQEAAFTATLISGAEPVTYEWDFGDGSAPVMGITVTHSYTATGTFTVTLTATDAFESVQVTHEFVVVEQLDADFISNSPIVLGETALFTNLTTGPSPITYLWDFGDGSTPDTDFNAEHVYTTTGTFTVTLTATNAFESVQVTHEFVVLEEQLEVDFTSNTPIVLGEDAVFTATLISGVEPVTYEWDFGDGSDPVIGITTTHGYTATGSYTVTLTATNDYESVQVVHEFAVLANLEVDFTSNSPITLGEEAVFTATLISGAEPVTYEWDFGDGSAPVMGITITHSYTATGTFTVTLTATNDFESVQVSHEFVVEPVPVEEYVIYMPLIYTSQE